MKIVLAALAGAGYWWVGAPLMGYTPDPLWCAIIVLVTFIVAPRRMIDD